MRTVKATVYLIRKKIPNWGNEFIIEEAIFSAERIRTINIGSINVIIKDNEDGDNSTLDEVERIKIAQHAADKITNAEDTPGHGWIIAPSIEKRTQYFDLTGNWGEDGYAMARITRRTSVEIAFGYTLLQRDLDGTTEYVLVHSTVEP
jgi:hypothetical protein